MILSFQIHPSAWWKGSPPSGTRVRQQFPFSCLDGHIALKHSFVISKVPFENLVWNAVNAFTVLFMGHTAFVQLVKVSSESILAHNGPCIETQRLRVRACRWEVTWFGPKSQKGRRGQSSGAGYVRVLEQVMACVFSSHLLQAHGHLCTARVNRGSLVCLSSQTSFLQ